MLDASGGVWDLGVLLLSLAPLLLLLSLRVAHTVHSPDMIILWCFCAHWCNLTNCVPVVSFLHGCVAAQC